MIELLSESKLKSNEYIKIRSEFYNLWNKLFLNKNQIDKAVYGKLWPLIKILTQTKLRTILPTFTSSELILRSNQLWMTRAWEYPWAVTNVNLTPNIKVLDTGSGWSLFPLYLAWKGCTVDSADKDKEQMEILSPTLANILNVKVNYSTRNILNLDVDNNTYDYAFSISVLEHLEEEKINGKFVNFHADKLDRVAIKELLRVVKPQGKVILTLDYASESVSKRSFHLDYITDLIEEFRNNLLTPIDSFRDIVITDETEARLRKLWLEFFPYSSTYPPCSALGIILTKGET